MFYDIFKRLCEENGLSPTKASAEIGFSKGSVSYWKKKYLQGEDAKPDSYTAEKIADFFSVSVDYLLGRTEDPIDWDSDSDRTGDALAEIPLSYVEACDGDMKRARAMMLAVDKDIENERRPAPMGARSLDQQLSGIDFALSGEIHDLTDNEKQDILDYIRFKKSQRGGGDK